MSDEADKFEGRTPGDWVVQRYTNYMGYSVFAEGRGCIAERWYDKEQDPPYDNEISANARLIAAAPRLLRERDEALAKCQRIENGIADAIRLAWADANLSAAMLEKERDEARAQRDALLEALKVYYEIANVSGDDAPHRIKARAAIALCEKGQP